MVIAYLDGEFCGVSVRSYRCLCGSLDIAVILLFNTCIAPSNCMLYVHQWGIIYCIDLLHGPRNEVFGVLIDLMFRWEDSLKILSFVLRY